MILSDELASAFHEDWRKTRLKPDGTFEPRWKKIKDNEFIARLNINNLPPYIRVTEGVYEIDIANTHYEQLSADWQAENKAAAEVVAEIINSKKPYTIIEIGTIIHDKWLERNDWAKGGELDVPFEKLPIQEQRKDIDQYRLGILIDKRNELANNLASAFHEDWRKTRLKPDGTFEPRWKKIKDNEFIARLNINNLPPYIRVTEGVYEIDIANAHYEQLSADWQAENKAAAEVVAKILFSKKQITREQAGSIIHDKWLERNDWARGGELDVPFDKLPKVEQDKDLVQYDLGKKLLESIKSKATDGRPQ